MIFSLVLRFLLDHSDVIDELYDAINRGASRQALKDSIRAAAVSASDAQMRLELGARPSCPHCGK